MIVQSIDYNIYFRTNCSRRFHSYRSTYYKKGILFIFIISPFIEIDGFDFTQSAKQSYIKIKTEKSMLIIIP
jgi:hypothetical protein